MNILVTGASGFIASHIVTSLLQAGHKVTCCVRDVSYTQKLFPTTTIIPCDFLNDHSSDIWIKRLKHIDAVINCVGVLYHPRDRVTWAIHYDTPKALFDACVLSGIQRIIQISALGIEHSDVVYATSKKAADDYLLNLPVKSIIIRPSLVYGRGSYGGSSLFRGLSGLPGFIPLPGQGTQKVQPIHAEDLSQAINKLLTVPLQQNLLLHAVSTKEINLNNLLNKMRTWLGFTKAKLVFIPLLWIRLSAKLGDLIPYSVLNTSSYKLLIQDNITSASEAQKFQEYAGFAPRDFEEGLYSNPSSIQDRWHARLFFLKPILRLSLAFIWLFTALCCLFFYPISASYQILADIGVYSFWQPILFYSATMLDAGIGLALLLMARLKKICLLQISLILSYSAILTWKLPGLWFEPFAPLAKNIPLVAAILVLLALDSDR